MQPVKSLYRQARERGNNARAALGIARRHISGPLAKYYADKKAWEAEPDKRRYAAGGSANRPKFPQLYNRDASGDAVPDGYRLLGFLKSENASDGLTDSPDFGYYADTWQDSTYYPCVLIRRTSEPHAWACVAAYFESEAEVYVFTDRNIRDLAFSEELFNQSEHGAGSQNIGRYELCRDARDAAVSALRDAESAAEEAREYDEKWQEASHASDKRDEARDELKAARKQAGEVLAALREQRAIGVAERVCNLLRANLDECRADMRRAIESIREHSDTIESLDMKGQF